MTQLHATPEGRPGLYILDVAENVVAWLDQRAADQHQVDETTWHCFIPTGPIMTGADWGHDEVVDTLRRPDVRLAINLDRNSCMLHQLAVADDTEGCLYVFDVGEVTLADLRLT